MKHLESVTASSSVKVKDPERVKAMLNNYEMTCDLFWQVDSDNRFSLHGYNWPDLTLAIPDGDEEDDGACFEEFLKSLAPFLEEPLVIHSIGYEKGRFPPSGQSVLVMPDGRVIRHRLGNEPQAFIKDSSVQKRGLVCMFCGEGFGYAGQLPDEATLKAANEHEGQCDKNPYKAKIVKLQTTLKSIVDVLQLMSSVEYLRTWGNKNLDKWDQTINALASAMSKAVEVLDEEAVGKNGR